MHRKDVGSFRTTRSNWTDLLQRNDRSILVIGTLRTGRLIRSEKLRLLDL